MVYLLIYDRDLILKKAKPILHKKEEGDTQQLSALFCEPAHVCAFS
ncbi:hypothetical protein UYSO10_5700 [Kosakonia radicincitans]|nr:hypothetical protein UYSO10_5700 [Kosakonia radicincitans]